MFNIAKYMLATVTFLMITLALTSCLDGGSQPWRLEGNADTDPTSNFLGTTDEQSLVIRTNAEERVRVTDDGGVGIGTTTPDAQLHVLAGDEEDGLVVRRSGDDNPDLLIDADSNVGINISDPSARFAIRNDSFGQRPLMSVLAGDATPFHMSSAGSVTIDPVGAGVALRVRASSSTSTSNQTPVPFYVSAADDANAIYVTRDGNVGIGTAGEGINDQLRVRGGENNGASASVRIVSGANQQTMLLDGNEIDGINSGLFLNNNSDENVVLATGGGRVGIGTSNPSHTATIVGGGNAISGSNVDSSELNTVLRRPNNAAEAVGLGFSHSTNPANVGAAIIHERTGGDSRGSLHFATKASTALGADLPIRMTIRSNGNVGIGTGNPNHELVVQGNDPAVQIRDDVTNNSANAARLELLERADGNFDGGAFLWWNGENDRFFIGTKAGGANTNVIVIDRSSNNVGIGTQNLDNSHKLSVNGSIRAKEIVVETGWSDFVFEPDYNLHSLEEVEAHIKEYRHLPDMPSAAQVAEHGVKVGEMEAKLLQKIEELTLHVIDMNKRVQALERENTQLRGRTVQLAAATRKGAAR